ncbi:selenium cofactor biosynthesis protein YqeC [Oribacterium sp.]
MTKQQGQIDDNPQNKLIRTPLAKALGIKKGINAVIGSGGKSSLLKSLSLELSQKGSVLLTTSTHILPFSHCENICFSDENISSSNENISILNENTLNSNENISALNKNISILNRKILLPGEDIHSEEEALDNSKALLQSKVLSLWDKSQHPILCLGTLGKNGKLSPFPLPFSALEQMADYVLVEADGSKRLPGKAHGQNEPQIPKESQRTILVFGASALHKPISEVIHRVEIFQNFFTPSLTPETLLTKELLLQAFRKENLGDCLFVNQLDCLTKKEAEELLLFLQKGLGKMVCGGSLKEGSAHPELFIL